MLIDTLVYIQIHYIDALTYMLMSANHVIEPCALTSYLHVLRGINLHIESKTALLI